MPADERRPDFDPRDLPAYSITEAAHYLDIPSGTLRAWLLGQKYFTGHGETKFFRPVISIADRQQRLLSFTNLVEAHVLDGLRRDHHLSLQKVRSALKYLARTYPSPHPLVDHRFATDGLGLFVERYGELLNVAREGQLAMRRVLEAYLSRIDRDPRGGVARLYPFTRRGSFDEPRAVVIDPWISFGRPVLAGTGIPTAVIAQRLKGGETIQELALDYERPISDIEEAIRCELKAA